MPLGTGGVGQCLKLGAPFSPVDPCLLGRLFPELARERFSGLSILPKGAASTDLIFDVVLNSALTLVGPVNDMKLHCELRFRQMRLRYKRFVDEYGHVGVQLCLGGGVTGVRPNPHHPLPLALPCALSLATHTHTHTHIHTTASQVGMVGLSFRCATCAMRPP